MLVRECELEGGFTMHLLPFSVRGFRLAGQAACLRWHVLSNGCPLCPSQSAPTSALPYTLPILLPGAAPTLRRPSLHPGPDV